MFVVFVFGCWVLLGLLHCGYVIGGFFWVLIRRYEVKVEIFLLKLVKERNLAQWRSFLGCVYCLVAEKLRVTGFRVWFLC